MYKKVRFILLTLKMAEIDMAYMSSKEQMVIPSTMRSDYVDGEKFVIIKVGKQIILKTITDFGENIKSDLEFAKRTEKAWKSLEKL